MATYMLQGFVSDRSVRNKAIRDYFFCAKKTKITISSFLGQSVTIHKSIMMHAFGATDAEHACAAPSLQAENAHVHILVLSIMPPVFGRSESSRI